MNQSPRLLTAGTSIFVCCFVLACKDPSQAEGVKHQSVQATPVDETSPKDRDDGSIEDVMPVFEAWKTAMLAHDGDAAVSLSTDESLDLFDRYRDLALHAPQSVLDELPLIDRMFVMITRLQLPAEQLQHMSRGELLGYLVNIHAMGMDYATYSRIDEVAFHGDSVTARHSKFSRQIGARLRLERTDAGVWKFDVRPVVKQLADDMDAYLATMDGNAAATTYADAIVETFTRRAIEPRHLQPLVDSKQRGRQR